MPARRRARLLLIALLPSLGLSSGCAARQPWRSGAAAGATGAVVARPGAAPPLATGRGLEQVHGGVGHALGQLIGLALAEALPYVATGVGLVLVFPIDLLTLPLVDPPFRASRMLIDRL
jgi:hypothetical protein